MMTPLAHYLFAFIVIYATDYHVKHRLASYAAMAVIINMLFEADHLFPVYAESHIKLFHNILFASLIPLTLFLASALAENRYFAATSTGNSRYQRFFLIFFLISTSHLMLDILDGGVEYVFYPFVKTPFVLNSSLSIQYTPFLYISPWLLVLLSYGLLVIIVRQMENRIYASMEGDGVYGGGNGLPHIPVPGNVLLKRLVNHA